MAKYQLTKIIFIIIWAIGSTLVFHKTVFAQSMMDYSSPSPDSTVVQNLQQEEQEGKKLLESLNNNTASCSKINDSDFEKIGEYSMGQSIGDTSRHLAMNEMMKSMMGEKNEEQMHIVMGKRLSGCDASAKFPQGSGSWFPMMPMMGGWSTPNMFNQGDNMMDYGFMPFGWVGGIFMVLWWILIIVAVIALIRWIIGQSRSENRQIREKSPLEILKERYAKGEIDKKEFEDKKKDLS